MRLLTTVLLLTYGYPSLAVAQTETSSQDAQPAAALAQEPDSAQPEIGEAIEAGGGLEEIVVTAQRRRERLQSVPIVISAFTGEQLANAGILRTSDLAVVTPGFVLTQGVGLGSPFLRGVGSTINGPGVENSVATYVDGVYQGIKSASLTSLDNIERVEVLKGPQGTLFGRNATGGLVQIITRDPSDAPAMNFAVGLANYDTVTASGYVTGGIAEGLAGDLAMSYRRQNEGWGTNVATGADVNQSDFAVLRSKWLWTPNDSLRMALAGDYGWTESSIGTAYRPVDGLPPARDGNRPFPGGDYDINANVDPSFRSRAGGLSLKVEQNLSFADLVSISAFRKGSYDLLLDSDVTPESYLYFDGHNAEKQFSQELQLVGGVRDGLQWTAGAYYYYNKGDQLNAQAGTIVPTRRLQQVQSRQVTNSYSLYGQATWSVAPALRITGGLRYTWENRTLDAMRSQFFNDGSVVVMVPPAPGRIDYQRLTWRAAVDYDIAKDVMLFASYNRGFKSGGFNGAQLPNETSPVRPEVLDALEAGLKSNFFGNRIKLNLSGFYYDFKDIQLSVAVLGVQTPRNAAAAEMYGVDLDFEALVTDRLRLSVAAEYLKGEYTSFPDANLASPLPAGGNSVVTGSATGNDLPRTPGLTATVGLDYALPVSADRDVRLNLTYSYNDGYFTEADNYMRQKAYHIANARISYPLSDAVTVSLWGRNLLNEFYTTALQAQGLGTVLSADEPRTYGIELRAGF